MFRSEPEAVFYLMLLRECLHDFVSGYGTFKFLRISVVTGAGVHHTCGSPFLEVVVFPK